MEGSVKWWQYENQIRINARKTQFQFLDQLHSELLCKPISQLSQVWATKLYFLQIGTAKNELGQVETFLPKAVQPEMN